MGKQHLLNRIGDPSQGMWATEYASGWTVFNRGRGVVAQSLSAHDAEELLRLEGD